MCYHVHVNIFLSCAVTANSDLKSAVEQDNVVDAKSHPRVGLSPGDAVNGDIDSEREQHIDELLTWAQTLNL